jgi:ribosomal protein L37AE/L43A
MFELFYYSEINKLKEDLAMKMPQVSLLEWQKKFGTEKACADAIARYRWPNGFMCPKCGHDTAWFTKSRKIYQCTKCKSQTSVTTGTLFHSTNLPLVKWFWAIYLIASDKGGDFLSNLESPGRQREIYLKKSELRWRTVTAYTACRIL